MHSGLSSLCPRLGAPCSALCALRSVLRLRCALCTLRSTLCALCLVFCAGRRETPRDIGFYRVGGPSFRIPRFLPSGVAVAPPIQKPRFLRGMRTDTASVRYGQCALLSVPCALCSVLDSLCFGRLGGDRRETPRDIGFYRVGGLSFRIHRFLPSGVAVAPPIQKPRFLRGMRTHTAPVLEF